MTFSHSLPKAATCLVRENLLQKDCLKKGRVDIQLMTLNVGGCGRTRVFKPRQCLDVGFARFLSVQFSSVQSLSCVRLFATMNHSTPGLPVHHQLPESTQTHVYQVNDSIQSSHPLSSPSPPALNLSQHQGLFQSVSSSHEVAKVLEFQPQHQSFQ